ncbi:MAG: hypothetical protein ACKVX7_04420 [Planctomycetota bacterium]
MSSVDKTEIRCFYEIEVDSANSLPKSIKMYVLTGVRGAAKDKSLETARHVSFIFDYKLDAFNQVAQIEVPSAVQKLLK